MNRSKVIWPSLVFYVLMWARASAVGQEQGLQGTECPPGCAPGRWSNEAVDLSSTRSRFPDQNRDIHIFSPDRQKAVHVFKDHWWIEIGNKKVSLNSQKSYLAYPAELAWAPDSATFYITWSVGATSGYSTQVFQLDDNRIKSLPDISRKVRRDFERRHKCVQDDLGNDPNIVGLKWVASNQLLVVAEVPNIGICKEAYYFGGYLISVARQISARYSAEELEIQQNKVMGWRLSDDLKQLTSEGKKSRP